MAGLGVNIDHVATVRQARRTYEPDPCWAAVEAQLGGADCITAHLREDRRHVNDRDMQVLKEIVSVKLNMEMSMNPGIVRIAVRLKPRQCTLVPEHRKEITTEGGLDVVKEKKRVTECTKKLKKAGAVVSLFIEPLEEQIEASADAGADAVELWTGRWANARSERERKRSLKQLERGLELGGKIGLEVHGGHGLTYTNIGPVASIAGFSEFNIGHSIIARAVFVGLRQATAEMKALLDKFSPVSSQK
jgi:pyridoxine 5-phosphate synthase